MLRENAGSEGSVFGRAFGVGKGESVGERECRREFKGEMKEGEEVKQEGEKLTGIFLPTFRILSFALCSSFAGEGGVGPLLFAPVKERTNARPIGRLSPRCGPEQVEEREEE